MSDDDITLVLKVPRKGKMYKFDISHPAIPSGSIEVKAFTVEEAVQMFLAAAKLDSPVGVSVKYVAKVV